MKLIKEINEYHYKGLKVLKERVIEDNEELLLRIDSKISSMKAGRIGEARLLEIFEKYTFMYPYRVLMNLNLEAGGKFQIDFIVMTEYFVLVLESKNISGSLRFEENPDRLERERLDSTLDVFESPEIQVERNCMMLQHWFYERGLPIPVIGAIVLTSAQHPIILKEPNRIPALFPKTVPVFLKKKWETYSQQRKYLNGDKLLTVAQEMQRESENNRYMPFPLSERWNIDVNQLKFGVSCLVCRQFGMKKVKSGWVCMNCASKEKDAHIRTIQEWFMIAKKTITNKECRDFLLVQDRHIAKRLLKSCNLEEIGSTRGTLYRWKWDGE